MSSRQVFVALASTAVTRLAVAGLASPAFDGIDQQAEDLLQPGTESTGEIVVVGIDRPTLQAIGEPWPWPRARHAQLLDAIGAAGPRLVIADLVFADPSDDDQILAVALREHPTVLASALTLRVRHDAPPEVVDAVEPVQILAESAAAVGHANVSVSTREGVVRSLPFYAVDERGVFVPSLAAAAITAMDGASSGIHRPEGLQLGGRLVPLDDGLLHLNWADELDDSGGVVSALDVLEKRVDPERLRGRIVLVGVTEPTLGDLVLVPSDKSESAPGVLVHANAINTVLARAWVSPAPMAAQGLLLALLALGGTAAFAVLRLRGAAPVAIALVAAAIAWGAWSFTTEGELWSVVWPVLTVLAASVTALTWRYSTETRHRRRAQALFGEYVPDNVLAHLGDRRRLAEAVEERRLEVVVLFCDLRGFTPVAADLEPAAVRRLLDHFYEYATEIVQARRGTVMQFVGDEVFAVFGAPVTTGDEARDAVTAAETLVGDVGRLDDALAHDGLPPVRFGVGVHRGEVVAAHVGTPTYRQYTVVGSAVNVASRLCGQAGAGDIVVSDAVGPDRLPPAHPRTWR